MDYILKVFFVLQIITHSLGLLPLMHTECSYGLGYQQGYQKSGSVQSTLTTKLKGAWRYNGSYGDYTQNCGNPVRNVTFDVADFVIPPLVNLHTFSVAIVIIHVVYAYYLQEPNEFFVMTNLWKTCNQTQGLCAEVSIISLVLTHDTLTHTHTHTHTMPCTCTVTESNTHTY